MIKDMKETQKVLCDTASRPIPRLKWTTPTLDRDRNDVSLFILKQPLSCQQTPGELGCRKVFYSAMPKTRKRNKNPTKRAGYISQKDLRELCPGMALCLRATCHTLLRAECLPCPCDRAIRNSPPPAPLHFGTVQGVPLPTVSQPIE